MATSDIENVNIEEQQVLTTPAALKQALPLTDAARRTVLEGRQTINNILDGKDPRLFLVVGPCSIHDPDAALDYARRLKALAEEVSDTLFLVMRVYFEKPRTTTGWKGLINDPHLDDSFDIERGLHIGRKLLLDIAELGVPTATEALDPTVPQYLLDDTISWAAIGARTTESQTHREMSSGLSMAVGFKNGTDGALDVAVNAMKSTANPHSFLGIDDNGKVAITRTRGNPYSHVVLRGGGGKPNYDSVNVALCEKELEAAGVRNAIMVDCSHANSNKDPAVQPLVMHDVSHQIKEGNLSIIGLMVESNIGWGKQPLAAPDQMQYGVSVTDACIDWETTEKAIRQMRDDLRDVIPHRHRG